MKDTLFELLGYQLAKKQLFETGKKRKWDPILLESMKHQRKIIAILSLERKICLCFFPNFCYFSRPHASNFGNIWT